MKKQRSSDKKTLITYWVLRLFVILVMIRSLVQQNYDNVFTCLLTLLLFMIPTIVDKKFNIKLPTVLENVILIFIFAAEILGEISRFYILYPYWDTILHTVNGFLMGAIGVAMVDILNQSPRFHFNLSPLYVAVASFCFSMTIGVLWEFFEYAMDMLLKTDMQKDTVVAAISTVKLNPEGLNVPVLIKDIQKTVIEGSVNGVMTQTVVDGGYLDIGLYDTIEDLLVNCIGALIFSVIGGFYVKNRHGFVEGLIPKMKIREEIVSNQENSKEA